MPISPYSASIPAFQHGFSVLSRLLDKAEAYAEEKNFKPQVLVDARLAPDMLSLAGQVQRLSDTAKGAASRLTATEAQDVVQETVISVARDLHKFKRDRSLGSFKGWLRNITR